MSSEKTESRAQPSFVSRLKAGVAGASVESLFRPPLTAMQTYSIAQKCSTLEAAKQIYALGGMPKFYDGAQGFAISYGTRIMQRAGMFSFNDTMREQGYATWQIIPAITGYEVAINSVSEISMTLAQAQTDKHHVASPLALFRQQVAQYGVKSVLGTGAKAMLSRNLTFNSLYMGIGNNWPDYKVTHPLATGMGSGMTAAVLSHPLEVIRARQVLSPSKSIVSVISETLAQEGARGFTRGMLPRVAGIGAGAGISYAAYCKLTAPQAGASR